jgi:aquaglyceroporin related protein
MPSQPSMRPAPHRRGDEGSDGHDSRASTVAGSIADDDGASSIPNATAAGAVDDTAFSLGTSRHTQAGSIASRRLRSSLWHLRWRMREFLAELVASTLLLAVGTSVNCQVKLSQSLSPSSAAGSYASQNWAWGLAVMCTIHLAGGISGAHANPGITISLAFFRGFPWRLVPSYLAAQLLGSFLGAALTYAMYLPSIERYQGAAGVGMRTIVGEGETGSLFTTVPAPYTTPASTFATELVASAILAMLVLCVGDESNSPPGDGMSGLIIGLAVTMIVSVLYLLAHGVCIALGS